MTDLHLTPTQGTAEGNFLYSVLVPLPAFEGHRKAWHIRVPSLLQTSQVLTSTLLQYLLLISYYVYSNTKKITKAQMTVYIVQVWAFVVWWWPLWPL